MIALAATPFALGVMLFLFGARIARQLPPSIAVWLLTALSLTVSVASGLMLSIAAILTVAQLPDTAAIGHWSTPLVRDRVEIPAALGLAAALLVAALLAAALLHAVRALRSLISARTVVRGSRLSGTGLVVVADAVPTAYAVAGLRGHIVVSTSMLRALSAPERRVLLAHEAAHLRYRHHVALQLAQLSAAANPLMVPIARAVALSVERWADEAAAAQVCDRELVARSLARAALARSGCRPVAGTLAAVDGHVTQRVRALLVPPPVHRWRVSATLGCCAMLCWIASGLIVREAHQVLEFAKLTHPH